MSDEPTYPSSAIIEDSYLAVCASWPEFAQKSLRPHGISYKWDPRPLYGSLSITLYIDSEKMAILKIRAATTERVLLSMTRFAKVPKSAYAFMWGFIAWRLAERERFAQLAIPTIPPASPSTDIDPTELEELRNRAQAAGRSEPPSYNASIDSWLDWRDAELRRGRAPHSVSLRKLAEQSRHSESQLKHASAARKRTKNGS